MEELHKVARAYYNNGIPQVRSIISQVFHSIDTNRDGQISELEFYEFLNREGFDNPDLNRSLFNELDRDRNRLLDFNEFITAYYVTKTRNGFCCQCWRCLKGLYFTCVTCFDRADARPFDLCIDCYNIGNALPEPHCHTNFVDSALLLRAQRRAPGFYAPGSSSSQAIQQLVIPNFQIPLSANAPDDRWGRIRRMVRTMEIALAATSASAGVAAASGSCNIM